MYYKVLTNLVKYMYLKSLLDIALVGIPYYTNIFTSQLTNPINAVIDGNNITITYTSPLPSWFTFYRENNSFITLYDLYFDIPFTNFTILQNIYQHKNNQEIKRVFFSIDVTTPQDFGGFVKKINQCIKIKSINLDYNNNFVILESINNNTLTFYIEVPASASDLASITNLLFDYNKKLSGLNGKHNIISITSNSVTYGVDENFNFNKGYNVYFQDIKLHYSHDIYLGDSISDEYLLNGDRRPVLVIKPSELRRQSTGTNFTDNNSFYTGVQIQTDTQEIIINIKIPADKKYNDNYILRPDIEIVYNEVIHIIKYILAGLRFKVNEQYYYLSSGLSFQNASGLDYSNLQIAFGSIVMEFNIETTKAVSSIIDEDRELHKITNLEINYNNQYISNV